MYYRLEFNYVGFTGPDLNTPWVITLFIREQPGQSWRVISKYCYADPRKALTEAQQLRAAYWRAGASIDHNLSDVKIMEVTVGREVHYVPQ